ncbi:unannotated protein [freshwater metagenome]|uniref:Unannotated protein n=1 Tax=freshwater metagenome TaxID=449393 RepID=A0A6J7C745_9ZZZZ
MIREWREQHLADEANNKARPSDQTKTRVVEPVFVLQVAEQREDDAVGNADAGGGDEERVPAGDAAAHTCSARIRTISDSCGNCTARST